MSEYQFETRQQASIAAAKRIGELISRRLAEEKAASVVVTGGTSPAECYEALSESELPWERVHVVLSDERWVSPGDDDSNEKLVRSTLLNNRAANATIESVYAVDTLPEARAAELDTRVRTLPFPFAAALLGMGTDGHFASLFPDFGGLDEALDPDSEALCVAVSTGASPHVRVSLTLSALSRSDEILLLFFGREKLQVYEQAITSPDTFPVSRLLLQKRAPVRVYWAP